MGIGYLIVKMLYLVLANHNYERLPTSYYLYFFLGAQYGDICRWLKKFIPKWS
jgi:hypothetical protein